MWLPLIAAAVARGISASEAPVLRPGCIAVDTDYVPISFDSAVPSHSNLGNQGPDNGSPPSIYIANIGMVREWQVDLEITNLTTYVPFRSSRHPLPNGLVEKDNGTFGVINLASPRSGDDQLSTTVTLRFAFINSSSRLPLRLPQTMFTFCMRLQLRPYESLSCLYLCDIAHHNYSYCTDAPTLADDIDTGGWWDEAAGARTTECIEVPSYDEVYLAEDTQLAWRDLGHSTQICATE